jgi:hypothetical protein
MFLVQSSRYRGLPLLGAPARTVSNDYVVRFEYRYFQILKSNKNLPRPKDKVTVLVRLDDSIFIQWKNNSLLVEEIEMPKNGCSGNNAA